MERVLSVCPFSGCGCGIWIETELNKIKSVLPSKSHPVNEGKLCIRGWKCYEFVVSDKRVKIPLIGRDNKRIAPWNDVLFKVVSALSEIKRKYGPDAIGVVGSSKITNEENYLLQKFAREVLETNNIDSGSWIYNGPTYTALKQTLNILFSPSSFDRIKDAEVIFLIGADPSSTHPQVASKIFKAKENGAKLVVVDPRKIFLAKHSDVYLNIKPESDIFLLLGLINLLIYNNRYEKDWIEKKTSGLDRIKKEVEKYTAEYVGNLCKVSPSDIRALANLIFGKKTLFIYSTGITQNINSTKTILSLLNLAILNSSEKNSCIGVLPLIDQNNAQGAIDMGCTPKHLPGYKKSSIPGLTLGEMISAAYEGKIKALYIVGENPVVSLPGTNYVREALSKLEFLVVQEIFLTETAKMADVVLPSACFAEKDGTFTSGESRLQRVRKIIEEKEAKTDLEIISSLYSTFGHPHTYKTPEEVFSEITKEVDGYQNIKWQDLENVGGVLIRKDFDIKDREEKIDLQTVEPLEEPVEQTEKYPYFLIIGRIKEHWNGGEMTTNSPTLLREERGVYVEINTKDAQEKNIKNGMLVRVSTPKGMLHLQVRVSEKVGEKILFIPQHFSLTPGYALAPFSIDPLSKAPNSKVQIANIEVV